MINKINMKRGAVLVGILLLAMVLFLGVGVLGMKYLNELVATNLFLDRHRWFFTGWRLVLYVILFILWSKTRRRAKVTHPNTYRELTRTGYFSVGLVVLFEFYNALRLGGVYGD